MSTAPEGALVLAGIAGGRLACSTVMVVGLGSEDGVVLQRLNPGAARQASDRLDASATELWHLPDHVPFPEFSWASSVAVVHAATGGRVSSEHIAVLREVTTQAKLTVVTADHQGATAADAAAFGAFVAGAGIHPTFVGCARRGVLRNSPDVVVAIVEPQSTPALQKAPSDFRVVAIVTAFNEEDIIVPTLTYLIEQGIEVHLVDNWSTDATAELARPFLGRGLLAIDQYPPGGPTGTYDWEDLLRHAEDVASAIDAQWFIHHDVDERRLAPWSGLSLRDGLYNVDVRGFTAIDHSHIDFHPTDNSFVPGMDPEGHFRWFAPPIDVHDNAHAKAWKNPGVRVDLATTGGHEARFPGRRVFPYNFLLKHYPFRSQQRGEKKVLQERRPRWNQQERKKGWHFGYDHVRQGHSFLRSEEQLYCFDEDFDERYLLERLAPIAKPVQQISRARRMRRELVPYLRRAGLLKPAVWVQRKYRVMRRRDVASGRQ